MNVLVTSSLISGIAAILTLFMLLMKTPKNLVLAISCLLLICAISLLIPGMESHDRKFEAPAKKIGVVVVTHGENGILIRQCIHSFLQILPKELHRAVR